MQKVQDFRERSTHLYRYPQGNKQPPAQSADQCGDLIVFPEMEIASFICFVVFPWGNPRERRCFYFKITPLSWAYSLFIFTSIQAFCQALDGGLQIVELGLDPGVSLGSVGA